MSKSIGNQKYNDWLFMVWLGMKGASPAREMPLPLQRSIKFHVEADGGIRSSPQLDEQPFEEIQKQGKQLHQQQQQVLRNPAGQQTSQACKQDQDGRWSGVRAKWQGFRHFLREVLKVSAWRMAGST